jgi:hypothetical protein
VVADAGLRAPQAPGGFALVVNLTTSPKTTAPLKLVTVAAIVELLVPSAGTRVGVIDTTTRFRGAVWVMSHVPLRPPFASRAVIVQVPTVIEAMYVSVSWPRPSVIPEVKASVPQEPTLLAVSVKSTASWATGDPLDMTSAVTVEVELPSAGRLRGLAVTTTPENDPVAPPKPPATSTRPSLSRVAVWELRAVAMVPADDQASAVIVACAGVPPR